MKAVIAVMLFVPAVLRAGEVLDSRVALDEGVYTIQVTARIFAAPERVFGFITDYERLPELNSSIRESSIIHTFSPLKHRLRTVMRTCILFFCRSVLQVQDIEQQDNTRLIADIIPALSDFDSGRATWVLDGGDSRTTTMLFTAQLEPSFWVPPVIGPWLFRYKVVSELLESAAYMEMNRTGPAGP